MWQTTNRAGCMTGGARTSQIRVFGKSMYTLAAGWIGAIGWLWLAEMQLHLQRHGVPPPEHGVRTLALGVPTALLLALGGWAIGRMAGRAPDPRIEQREWWYSVLWSAVPNALLFFTVWVMIQEAR